jgi:RNA 2',3'-cyclic 3'-phosphodiesterase
MTEGWQRCFIALAPDDASRAALAAIPVPATARHVPDAQLHLTVAFIGALSMERGSALIEALQAQSIPVAPAAVTRIAHWPGPAHPKLTVAELATSDDFTSLDWRIRSLMLELGLPVDARAFRPHVTLARFGRDAPPAERVFFTPGESIVRFDSLALYSSTLARRGARYEALTAVPLSR